MTTILLIIVGAVVFLMGLGFMFTKVYTKATTNMSFVRTGAGGKKVISEGGAMVIPGIHETMPVNMETIIISVIREREDALTTKDKIRADVKVDFYIKVKRDKDSISKAAETLADTTLNPEALRKKLQEKLVGGMRSTASIMNMSELHENRDDFVQKIKDSVQADLDKNGIELETVALSKFNQTEKEFFNENNVFDAEGLRKITESIESQRKITNAIEKETQVEIDQKNLEARTQSLAIAQEVAAKEEEQKTEIANKETEEERKREEADIKKNRAIEEAKLDKERSVEEADLEAKKSIALKEQQNQIDISAKVEEEAQAKAKANEARALEVQAQEKVETSRAIAIEEREKELAIIEAQKDAEVKSTELIVAAKAEKEAAQEKADALEISSKSEADALKVKVEAKEKEYKVEAEGKTKLNQAENLVSGEILENRLKLALIENMPNIIKSMTAPMENIESIKIVDMGNGLGSNSTTGETTGQTNLPDSIVNSALKYKVTAPLMEKAFEDVGLNLDSFGGITAPLNDIMSKEATDSVVSSNTSTVGETITEENVQELIKKATKKGNK
jgi:flotillin